MQHIECGLKYFYRLAWIKKAHDAPGKYEAAHITGDLLFIGRSFYYFLLAPMIALLQSNA